MKPVEVSDTAFAVAVLCGGRAEQPALMTALAHQAAPETVSAPLPTGSGGTSTAARLLWLVLAC